MLSSSHRHGRACRAPPIELQMSSAHMFDVIVIHATVTSTDRARCEQSRKNTLFLAAEIIQNTRTSKLHISSRSFQHSVTFMEISIFLTSGCAEKTDGEQGIEYIVVTNDAVTKQVPRSCRASDLLQRFPVAIEQSTSSRFSRDVCEQDTPSALLRQNP